VAFPHQNDDFGIQGYSVPYALHWQKTKTFFPKSKKENFIEKQAQSKKSIPAPSKFTHIWEWNKMNKGKGKFLKGARVTSTENIFLEAKKVKQIGPHTYHPYKHLKEKIVGMPK
jgi:hypothetical protein